MIILIIVCEEIGRESYPKQPVFLFYCFTSILLQITMEEEEEDEENPTPNILTQLCRLIKQTIGKLDNQYV